MPIVSVYGRSSSLGCLRIGSGGVCRVTKWQKQQRRGYDVWFINVREFDDRLLNGGFIGDDGSTFTEALECG